MPVLTHKQFEKGKKSLNREKKATVKRKSEDDLSKTDISLTSGEPKKSPEETFKYYLLHPENGAGTDLQNFEDVITIEEKQYKRICKNGSVITKEKPLADFLIKKGYILMEKIKVA